MCRGHREKNRGDGGGEVEEHTMKKDRTEIERRRALVGKSKIGSHCRAGEGDRPQAWFLHVDRTLSPVSGSERNRGEILLCRGGTRARERVL